MGPTRPRRPRVFDAAQTALIPLRPLTMGEILDGAFLVVRRNARLMVGLPLVLAGGAALYVLLGVGLWFLLGNSTVQGAQLVVTVLMGLVGLLVLGQFLVWMTAILSRVTLQTVLGDGFAPSSSAVTLRSSLPLFWPLLGLSLLQYVASSIVQTVVSVVYYLAIAGVALAGISLGSGEAGVIIGIIVSVVALLLLALGLGYLTLTVPALSTESRHAPGWIGKPYKPTNVITSFERSFRLIGIRQAPRVACILIGAAGVSLVLIGLLAFGALALVVLFATSVSADLTVVLTSPWTIGGVLAFAILTAMSALLAYIAAVQTLLYLDLRMRREGLDLALRFDCVPIPQPSQPPMPSPYGWNPAPNPAYLPQGRR